MGIVTKIKEVEFLGEDFLADGKKYGEYDRIIANPPFTKNQDIDHIYEMYKCLKVGGRLVTMASKHWQLSTNQKETEFREWLKRVNYDFQEIESGKFKESGTTIGTVMLIINK